MAHDHNGHPRQRTGERGFPYPDGTPLAEAKLRAPPLRDGMLSRPDLVELLNAGRGRKLTLLSAPTGYGKTTLLAQWHDSEREDRPFVWVSLGEEDRETLQLCAHLVEAVDHVESGLGRKLGGLPQNSGGGFDSVVLARVVEALAALPRGTVIVLDDYHLLEVRLQESFLSYLLRSLPATVQLVVSTRTEPPVPLGRLRAIGELIEVRAAELCFGAEEARVLLRASIGAGVDDEDLNAIRERTEGWPAGLYLATLAFRRSEHPGEAISALVGSTRYVADYLAEEVLEHQAPNIRRFLLHTSILQKFNASLCDAVTGEENSAGMLNWLERSNLFLTPLDGQREWYRYHHLFADLLRLELKNSEPGTMPELHRRAAAWYLEVGDVGATVHHTLAAGDFRRAGTLVARHWLTYLKKGKAGTLRSWLAQIPGSVVSEYPPLGLVNAWLSVFEGDFAACGRWLSVAESAAYEGPLPDGTSSLESGVAVLRASHPQGGVRQACESARRAVELESGPSSPWRSLVHGALGYNLYWADETEEARSMLTECLRLAHVSPTLPATVLVATGFLALIEFEDGRTTRAERLAFEALAQAEAHGLDQTFLAGTPHVVLGGLLASQGNLVEAEKRMLRGISLNRQVDRNPCLPHALLTYAPVRKALGDRAGAQTIFEEAYDLLGEQEDPAPRQLSRLAEVGRKLRLNPRRTKPGQALSEAEAEVLRLLARGLERKEIAGALYLSVNTVKSHLRSAYRKLGATSREEALDRARGLGLSP